jgi:hypothetical protein
MVLIEPDCCDVVDDILQRVFRFERTHFDILLGILSSGILPSADQTLATILKPYLVSVEPPNIGTPLVPNRRHQTLLSERIMIHDDLNYMRGKYQLVIKLCVITNF